MDIMIISKWTTDFTGRTDRAPSIIQTMIALFINLGALPKDQDNVIADSPKTQETVSLVLLVLVVICVPTLLCCKPCIFLCFSSHDSHSKVHEGEDEFVSVKLVDRDPKDKDPLDGQKRSTIELDKDGS